jgi:hypothetical protein
LAAIRAAIDAPIDLYVEAPDNIGGFIRHYEVPDFIRQSPARRSNRSTDILLERLRDTGYREDREWAKKPAYAGERKKISPRASRM